jgi:hypothetical protein
LALWENGCDEELGGGYLETRKYTPQDSDITVDLISGLFVTEDSQELAESLRAKTDLQVESGLFDYYSEGDPFPPEVILGILYTLFPLKDIYAGVLSSMLWEKAKEAHARHQGGRSKATFLVRKVDEDGRTLKEVGGVTSDPEIIKDMIRRANEEGETDYFHVHWPR